MRPRYLTGVEAVHHWADISAAIKAGEVIQHWNEEKGWYDVHDVKEKLFVHNAGYYQVKPKPKVMVRYYNGYETYAGNSYRSRVYADASARSTRTCCIRVEFVEGQFDE